MYNEEFYNETENTLPCGKNGLLGTVESGYRQWKERKRLERLYGKIESDRVNMIEEGHFHYLPYGV